MGIPQLYKVEDVAERLDVSYKTVLRAIKGGLMSAVKVGNNWRLSDDNVNEYLQKRTLKASKKY
jgi:excisionase family DNA binding protein